MVQGYGREPKGPILYILCWIHDVFARSAPPPIILFAVSGFKEPDLVARQSGQRVGLKNGQMTYIMVGMFLGGHNSFANEVYTTGQINGSLIITFILLLKY